jgi:hypothetical protein
MGNSFERLRRVLNPLNPNRALTYNFNVRRSMFNVRLQVARSQQSEFRMKYSLLTPELTLRSHDYAWALPHTAVCILNTLTHVTPLVCSRSAGGWLAENFNVRRSFFGNFKLDDGRRVKGPADSRRPALLV